MQRQADIAVTGEDDKGMVVWVADINDADRPSDASEQTEGENLSNKIRNIFEQKWAIRGRMVSVKTIDKIPRNSSGKIIYKT